MNFMGIEVTVIDVQSGEDITEQAVERVLGQVNGGSN